MGHSLVSLATLNQYVEHFNADDDERYVNTIPNSEALEFLAGQVPLFECPDETIERTYYFRWWTFRKHIKRTPDGYVITEFLPDVPWAGKHNTINCPAGHHVYEGRWLRDARYLDDYSVFWLRRGGALRQYSTWLTDALYARHLARPCGELLVELLPDLVANDQAWERGWHRGAHRIGRHDNGLYYTLDDLDGGEVSIGGHGYRPTLNSFMFGDAKAIAAIARLADDAALAERFDEKADTLKRLVQERLWDAAAGHFKVLKTTGELSDVRELYGYTPWQFNLPDEGYEAGWAELMNPDGFFAPFGPTFAEQRHPAFVISYEGHECQWNGPSWPLATSGVLTAMANLLNNYEQDVVDKHDYFKTLSIYAASHRRVREDGKVVPWIDENLNPYTGDWIARSRLKSWRDGTWDPGKGGVERGKDYNHSSFCDLIITGLVGLRPRPDAVVEVNPLLPNDAWDDFCLDRVPYHGRRLTITWDRHGERYGRGAGLVICADGREIARSPTLGRVTGELN